MDSSWVSDVETALVCRGYRYDGKINDHLFFRKLGREEGHAFSLENSPPLLYVTVLGYSYHPDPSRRGQPLDKQDVTMAAGVRLTIDPRTGDKINVATIASALHDHLEKIRIGIENLE